MKGDNILFNNAGSSLVKNVYHKTVVKDQHMISMTGIKNSVTQSLKDGKILSERFYDEDGNAYLDIDYSDHGNKKTHPHVPHQHRIKWENGKPIRGKEEEVH